jgi:predicted phosphodiesterase
MSKSSTSQTLRVGVLSDFHGSHKRPAFDYFVAQAQPDLILCCGDLQDYRPYSVPFKFIRGNHEDWDTLAALAAGTKGVRNLEYLIDGQRLSLAGASVLGIGGNWSPTGKTAPRYIGPAYLASLRSSRADIVLSHETPLHYANDPSHGRTLEPLRELCAFMSPKLWFSGHHHYWETERLGRTQIISLGRWPHEWVVLDIDRGALSWDRWVPANPADYESRLPRWRTAEEVQKRELLSLERRGKRR